MTLPPLWTPDWWATVATLATLAILALWALCGHSLLLQQIVWPPLIEGGHYQSKRWKTETRERYKANPNARCVICGCQGEKTWHLFSVQRKGWRWRIIAARSTSRALQLHELVYSYIRSPRRLPRRYGWMMCPTHHAALHRLDKILFRWDRRNRFLWLTSFVYRGTWYAAYAAGLAVPAFAVLWFWQPDVAHRIVTTAMKLVR